MDPSVSISRLLFIGLVFHLCLIGSVFDAYFTSPVVGGMRHFGLNHASEAKRLVLIVGDGLRADLLFKPYAFRNYVPEAPEIVAPYLRTIVNNRGAWGISHTRVPTESRPGHVALIGGMYEDVSAVTKGWKTNPVDFDSVFNQSSSTYSFGSPDILPMFARGATPGKVKTWSYNEEDEDFTKDATALDVWALDHLRELFQNATQDQNLAKELHRNKVVFFLHLLGLDTTGHSYRPHSREYMHNIEVVDEIVRQTEDLVNNFYQDTETAFVFTADHGMSVIGNHGDGHPDNTRTPLIAWGKGVRGPLADSIPSSHDAYSSSWGLTNLYRRDVEQADIAPIMASLLGINWPVNSVGVLPDVDPHRPGFLQFSGGEKTRADAALVNARVLLEHFSRKAEIKRNHTLLYKPYLPLESLVHVGHVAARRLDDIEGFIGQGRFVDALDHTQELIQLTLEGLRYLQTYDRFLIQIIVVAAYTGWIAHGASIVLLDKTPGTFPRFSWSLLAPISILATCWASFALQHSPWSFYVYVVFPVYFWNSAISRTWSPVRLIISSNRLTLKAVLRWMVRGIVVVTTLICMVLAYTHRSLWSVGFVIIGIVWPLLSWPLGTLKRHGSLVFIWSASCIVAAIFPLLSVDKNESVSLIMVGGTLMVLTGIGGIKILQETQETPVPRMYLAAQIFLINMSLMITRSSVRNLQAKAGLPTINQAAGWTTLIASIMLPLCITIPKPSAHARLLSLFLTFGPLFVILSISVEGLFYLAYATTLILWIEMESALRNNSTDSTSTHTASTTHMRYQPQADDLRIALFFLFFIQVGFFGTGNVASISSFYLAPVYRLVPVFNPFLMTTLLIFKIIAPYVLLSAAFATLNDRLRLPPFSLFLVALTITDVMTIIFFFRVTDSGSWLEIGQSISFFCIASLLVFFSSGICATGGLLMGSSLHPVAVSAHRKHE